MRKYTVDTHTSIAVASGSANYELNVHHRTTNAGIPLSAFAFWKPYTWRSFSKH